jgi:hypothetical protein
MADINDAFNAAIALQAEITSITIRAGALPATPSTGTPGDPPRAVTRSLKKDDPMTQPTEAVGGEPIAPDLTPEERLDAAFAVEGEPQDELPAEGEEAAEGEPEDELPEDEIEIEAEDLPPIDAPVSWTAEDKAKFADLPRELQETVQKREAEREKFVQSKAQEVTRERTNAMREAAEYVQQLQAEKAQQLEHYAQQFAIPEPNPELIVNRPRSVCAGSPRPSVLHRPARRSAAAG